MKKKLEQIWAEIPDFVALEEWRSKPYTYIKIQAIYKGKTFTANDVSECSPHDEWNTERGHDIALGRAKRKLAEKIIRWKKKQKAIAKQKAMPEHKKCCAECIHNIK